MHLIRWLMVVCWSWSALISEDVGELPASTVTLSQVMSRLSDAQAQVQSNCASVGVVVPSGLTDVLVVRRTIAVDWERKLVDGRVLPKDPVLVRFIGDQERLIGNLQQLVNVVQQLVNLPQRFPHSTKEAAFVRYRALLLETIDQSMGAVAGRQVAQVAPADWYQRQSRHTDLLTLIESAYTSAERYAKLPQDDRQLAEYREQIAQARTTLEQKTESGGNDDNQRRHSSQTILDAYTSVLDARVQMIREIEESTESGLEANAPAVMTLCRATEVLVQLGDRRLALIRGEHAKPLVASSSEDQDDQQALQELEQERNLARAQRLISMASQWLSWESTGREQAKGYAEQITSAPPTFIETERTVMNALTEQQRAAQVEFDRAITAADVSAALTAQQVFERIRQQRDRREQNLGQEVLIAEHEGLWRAQAKDPAMAERLQEWDKHRAAMLAAQHTIAEAEDAALAAKHAVERAEWIASQAEERVQEVRQNSDKKLDLSDLMQSLDQLIEQPEVAE